jgi:hypothetical protein
MASTHSQHILHDSVWASTHGRNWSAAAVSRRWVCKKGKVPGPQTWTHGRPAVETFMSRACKPSSVSSTYLRRQNRVAARTRTCTHGSHRAYSVHLCMEPEQCSAQLAQARFQINDRATLDIHSKPTIIDDAAVQRGKIERLRHESDCIESHTT